MLPCGQGSNLDPFDGWPAAAHVQIGGWPPMAAWWLPIAACRRWLVGGRLPIGWVWPRLLIFLAHWKLWPFWIRLGPARHALKLLVFLVELPPELTLEPLDLSCF